MRSEHTKQKIPYEPGYGVLGCNLPHTTIDLSSVVIHYKRQVARVDPSRGSALVGPFLHPEATSYIYESGALSLCFRTTPTENGVLEVEYDWQPNTYYGAQVQLKQRDGSLTWVPIEDLREALNQAPKQS